MGKIAADPGDVLAILLERFVIELLDQSKADGIRGNLTGAAVRRVIARDLSATLQAWREEHGRIVEVVGEEALP